ncbi:hypothetical protein evm_008017 [Chilo suppressalis]|nr:hypothetical protein evm_008017 [Chilo suppressalis]
MGKLSIHTARLAAILILHAAGAGLASPTVLVTRTQTMIEVEWLLSDNQTIYNLREGESRSLELNTTNLSQTTVFITISPCTNDFHWSLYHGKTHNQGPLTLLKNYVGGEMKTFSIFSAFQDRYVLQLSTVRGGSAAVSVRGEANKLVRLRLHNRSRRRLVANWDPSPIDPQSTTYCVVASHKKNYTSLCAAQCDSKANRLENLSFERSIKKDQSDDNNRSRIDCSDAEVDNKIEVDPLSVFDASYKTLVKKRKFGRSTKASDVDPVIACIGERTHHLIENLDPAKIYYVSVFGVASDRQSGSLLATSAVLPRTSTTKRLKENVSQRAEIKGRAVYYFKATVGAGGGLWLVILTCGGAVDVEVLVRGKRLHLVKNVESHSKFFVPAPIPNSSIQDISKESSIQFDSSSEETRIRYVIKVTPSKRDKDRSINVEIAASTTRWGINLPELPEDGSIVRELRPKKSCRSLDIAFLPATHNATNAIRTKVIVQKINGLRAGRKYAIRVTAATKGIPVPYKVLYADTNVTC